MKKFINGMALIKTIIHDWSLMRAMMMASLTFMLTACVAAVLLAVGGGSFSSSIAMVAVLAFPYISGDRLTLLIPTGPTPHSMVIEPNGHNLYIAENNSISIAKVDTTTYEISNRLSLNDRLDSLRLPDQIGSPINLVFTPNGDRLYVTTRVQYPKSSTVIIDDNPKGLLILNPDTMQIESRIDTKGSPAVLTFTPDGQKAYVANTEATIAVLNSVTLEISSIITVDKTPLSIAISSGGKWLVVANTGDLKGDPSEGILPNPGNTVSIIDTQKDILIKSLTVGEGPSKILMHGTKAYVLNEFSGSVSIIDLTSQIVIKEIPVGSSPRGAALNEKTNRLYVSSYDDQKITVINTKKDEIENLILIENKFPTALAATKDGDRLFAILPYDSRVVAYDLLEENLEPEYIKVGQNPIAITIQDKARQGFALAATSNDITVFDTYNLSIKAISALELAPFSVTVDPRRNLAYVTNAVHNTISLIDFNSNTVVKNIEVGPQPIAMVIDVFGKFGYSVNHGDDSISKVDLDTQKQVTSFRYPGNISGLRSISISQDGATIYILGESNQDCGLVAINASDGTELAKWNLPYHSVSDLAWGYSNRYLYILGTYAGSFLSGKANNNSPRTRNNPLSSFDSGGVMVSRLETSTGIITELFVIPDIDSVSFAITNDEIIVLGDVTNRQVYQINANNISDYKVIDTNASDFISLSQSGNRVFVSDAGEDYPYFDIFGSVVGVDFSKEEIKFSDNFDNRVSGLIARSESEILYATLTSQDKVAIIDSSNGAIIKLVSLPKVQRLSSK